MEIKIGQFENISNYEYHNMMPYAYSNSDLKAFGLSPANLIQKRNGPQGEKKSLNFGRALHSRLEFYKDDTKFLNQVATMLDIDRRTKEGKIAYEQFMLDSVNKIVLNQDEGQMIDLILEAMEAHPDAKLLLEAEGKNENTFVWLDEDSGLLCKCRPDKYIANPPAGMPKDGMIIDWKSTQSCDLHSIRKACAEYDYHIQAAFYIDGVSKVLGRSGGEFINCFIEKGNSYRTVLGFIKEEYIQIGREIYKERLMRLSKCQKDNLYPGFIDISLPDWKVLGV